MPLPQTPSSKYPTQIFPSAAVWSFGSCHPSPRYREFDAVFDFDEAVRDPNHLTQILPAYSGDQLHVNDVGNSAQANAISVEDTWSAVGVGERTEGNSLSGN